MKTFYMIIKLALMVILLYMASGCTNYMKLKYGMTEPKEETPEGLISFLEKQKFPTRDMYMFSDSASYCQTLRDPIFGKNMLSHMNFDRDGILLLRDTTQCQWQLEWRCSFLPPFSINGLVTQAIVDETTM